MFISLVYHLFVVTPTVRHMNKENYKYKDPMCNPFVVFVYCAYHAIGTVTGLQNYRRIMLNVIFVIC